MSGFVDILRKGKKVADMKESGGDWGRCEECVERKRLYPYPDGESEIWMLCESCINLFIREK